MMKKKKIIKKIRKNLDKLTDEEALEVVSNLYNSLTKYCNIPKSFRHTHSRYGTSGLKPL